MSFKITPNSLGVVYQADQLVNERYDLFSVHMAGSEKLAHPISATAHHHELYSVF